MSQRRMSYIITILITSLAIYVYRKLARNRAYERKKRENGCQDPPKYPHLDPLWGLDLFFADFQAMANGDVGLAKSRSRFSQCGKTWEKRLFGMRVVETTQSSNVQTVLAGAFENFGLAPLRAQTDGIFMNQNIMTTDGPHWRFSRSLVKPTFARVEIADLAFLETSVTRLVQHIPLDGSTVDLQPLFKALVSQLLCP